MRFFRGFARFFVRFSVVLTVLLLIVQFSPLAPLYARWLAGPWADPDGDILVVLTADEMPDGIVGPASYLRAVYAVRAWREGHFRAMVISGGHTPGSQISLAAAMGQFVEAYGIPKDRIFLEERSSNTRENALFTERIIESWPGKVVLLTSDFHMFRARRTFEAAGLVVEPRPFPDVLKHWGSPLTHISDGWTLLAETFKIGWYWLKGWIHLP